MCVSELTRPLASDTASYVFSVPGTVSAGRVGGCHGEAQGRKVCHQAPVVAAGPGIQADKEAIRRSVGLPFFAELTGGSSASGGYTEGFPTPGSQHPRIDW
ncbi:hypothetical protein N7451_012094 [Penicillium sp. IBT 35674x]|nr:hypothetical protein N7451_012094 [Penicillium sp. IBT 35674x]